MAFAKSPVVVTASAVVMAMSALSLPARTPLLFSPEVEIAARVRMSTDPLLPMARTPSP
ncbi:hypothetical protein D3C85_1738630 [compost metagenome]